MSQFKKGTFEDGYVQVYTGNGKGKTTAALGLACRAVGHNMRVVMIQFMKGSIDYGELNTAKRLAPNLTIIQQGRENFVNRDDPDPIDVKMAQEGVELAKRFMQEDPPDILILDELNVALDFGLVSLDQVLELLKLRPEKMELVLTGRYAPPGYPCRAAEDGDP